MEKLKMFTAFLTVDVFSDSVFQWVLTFHYKKIFKIDSAKNAVSFGFRDTGES